MKRQKKVYDYSQKSIDYLKLIVVNPPLNLTNEEKRSIATSFGYSSQDHSIENNSKIILTRILNHCNGNKSSARLSTHALKYSEPVSLKVYSIELK